MHYNQKNELEIKFEIMTKKGVLYATRINRKNGILWSPQQRTDRETVKEAHQKLVYVLYQAAKSTAMKLGWELTGETGVSKAYAEGKV
jgi:hypothetical protein